MSLSPERIAIVGAGPIGLEAALFGVQAGFDVNVFERASFAHNVFDWGHVRLFSPFGLNASEWGRRALVASGTGDSLPAHDELLTGREFASRYLRRLSELPELEGRIHENTEVRSIGRSQTWKGDFVGNSSRADDCFQLLLHETVYESFRERTVLADYVFDCSGTYGNHNWVGAGGMPCLGESSELTEADYRLPDILGEARQQFAGKTTLVVGSGYSAATDVVALAKLVETNEATRILWVTRSHRTPPMTVIENDQLLERSRLAETANRLALSPDRPVQWLSGRLIHRIGRASDATGYIVCASKVGDPESSDEQLSVDRLIANVGYRPDRRLYEELQVHECYASSGPISLAAVLLGDSSLDCLSQTSFGPDSLRNPEPGFFILGSKSYGRDSRFLIKVGFEQIRDVFQLVTEDSSKKGRFEKR